MKGAMPLTVHVHGDHCPGGEGAPESVPPALTFDSPRISLGRGDACDVRLLDLSVGIRHAAIRLRGQDYTLVDEGSTNGTRLVREEGGQRHTTLLTAHAPQTLRAGDLVRLGRVWLSIGVGQEPPTRKVSEVAKAIALDMAVDALAREGEDGRPRLWVEAGPDAGMETRLSGVEPVIVGRSKEATLALSDPGLSRRHLEIARRGEVLVVRDLGSKAGSTLGEAPLGDAPQVWRPGVPLSLGASVLCYEFAAAQALAELERAPDVRVPASELTTPSLPPPESEDPEPVEEAEDVTGGDEDEEEGALESEAPRLPARTDPAAHARWSITDFAVVLLAMGVFSLSAVGYFVLLR